MKTVCNNPNKEIHDVQYYRFCLLCGSCPFTFLCSWITKITYLDNNPLISPSAFSPTYCLWPILTWLPELFASEVWNTGLGMAVWSSTEVVLFPRWLILCGVFFWSLMDTMGIITGFPAITEKCCVSSLSQGNLWTWSCSSAAFKTFGDLPLLLAWSPKLLTWPLSSYDAGPAYFLTRLTPFCLAVCTATTLAFLSSQTWQASSHLMLFCLSESSLRPPHSLGLRLNAAFWSPSLVPSSSAFPTLRLG